MMLLTLLTDFGLTDYYVAAVKGTVLRLAPGTVLVDISHDVPAGDVETGGNLSVSLTWRPAPDDADVELALVVDAELFRLEAVVRWLDAADTRLTSVPVPSPVAKPPVQARRQRLEVRR